MPLGAECIDITCDYEWITEELRELPKQSAFFSDVPDDPEYVRSYLMNLDAHCIMSGWCVREEGAFLLYTTHKPWYANRVEASEMILWVPAERRGKSRAALQLVQRFTEWVDATPEIYCAHAGSSLDIVEKEKVLKLYEHFGWQRHDSGVIRKKACVDGKYS